MAFNIENIEKTIGYCFKDKELLKTAFVHSSFANEHKLRSNERLEFLGDSVLSIIVTKEIYSLFKLGEGDLSKIRASLTCEKTLAFVFEELNLKANILVGQGLIKSEPTAAMKADCFEAMLGAIYLDGGIEPAKRLVLRVLESPLKDIKKEGVPESHKSLLQEKFKNAKISYRVSSSGEGNEKFYTARVYINGTMSGIGHGTKKREAEENSAFEALERIKKA